MNKDRSQYESEGKGPFKNSEDVVKLFLSLLDRESLSQARLVSRFFNRKCKEISQYLFQALNNKGFTIESIQHFNARLTTLGIKDLDYAAMFQRFSQLNSCDYHIFSEYQKNAAVVNTFWFDYMHIHRIHNSHLLLACLCGNFQVLNSFAHIINEYAASAAYLFGMANMPQLFFQWLSTFNLPLNFIMPFCKGLLYKGHLETFMQVRENNLEFINSFTLETKTQWNNLITEGAIACHDPAVLRFLEKNYPEIMLTLQESNPYRQHFIEACSLSKNPTNFIKMSAGNTASIVQNVGFIFGVIANRNYELFKYLLENNILSPNQAWDINFPEVRQEPIKAGHYHCSVLKLACYLGCLRMVKILIEQYHCVINDEDNQDLYTTPLMIALESCHLAVANYLCSLGMHRLNIPLIDPDTDGTPLHSLMKFNILEIQSNYPDLYRFAEVLINTEVTDDMYEGEYDYVGKKLVFVEEYDSPFDTIDVAYQYQQMHNIIWLKMKNIIKNGNGLNSLRYQVSILHPQRSYYCSRHSLRDVEASISPSPPDNENRIYRILKILIGNCICNHLYNIDKLTFPEQHFFIADSIEFLVTRYKDSIDVSKFVTAIIDWLISPDIELDSEDLVYSELIFDVIANKGLFNDIFMPLIRLDAVYMSNDMPNHPIVHQSSLMHIAFKKSIKQKPWFSEMGYNLSCLLYFLAFKFLPDHDVFNDEDRNNKYLHRYDNDCLHNLIADTSDEKLALCSPLDPLKRNAICLILDQYFESHNPEEFALIEALVKRKVDLNITDAKGISALDRVLNHKDDSNLFKLFKDTYGSYCEYFKQLSDIAHFEPKKLKMECS